jgi:hypothetical protein
MLMAMPAQATGSITKQWQYKFCPYGYSFEACIPTVAELPTEAECTAIGKQIVPAATYYTALNNGVPTNTCYYVYLYSGGGYYWNSFGTGAGRYECPSNTTPSYAQYCGCNAGYVPNQAGTACVQECLLPKTIVNGQCILQETYTLTLTPNTVTIEPKQSYTFNATVTKQGGGAPDKDIPVTVEVKVDVISGGHDHGEKPINDVVYKRPKGTLSTTSGNTSFPITFTAEDISGTHTVIATCEQCVEKTKEAVVTVRVPGLEQIPDSQFYQLYERVGNAYKAVGETAEHHSNHFLTPAASEVLWRIASAYRFEPRFMKAGVLPLPLHVNDASLKDGGKFDINGTWTGSHKEHTRGVSVDIRANTALGAIARVNFDTFNELLFGVLGDAVDNGGVDTFLRECTKDKPSTPENPQPQHKRTWAKGCVSQLDGSQDIGRHYHLRLMGVAK